MKDPDFLYHFTTIDKAVRFILPDFSLRMNQLSNTNDPKENLIHKIEFQNYLNQDDASEFPLAQLYSSETKILSFSTDYFREEKRIYGYQLQRMWAQYGGNNSGVCLVIDYRAFKEENRLFFESNRIKSGYIRYADNLKQRMPSQELIRLGDKVVIHDTDFKFWDNFKNDFTTVEKWFFTKNKDWEGESEYRLLKFKDNSEEDFLSIKNSLSSIYLGLQFSKHYLPSLKSLAPNVDIYNLKTDGCFNLIVDQKY
jgi:hypothetical protein